MPQELDDSLLAVLQPHLYLAESVAGVINYIVEHSNRLHESPHIALGS